MLIKSKRRSRRSARPSPSQQPAVRNATLNTALRAVNGLSIALGFDGPVVGTERPTGIRYQESPGGTLHTPTSVRFDDGGGAALLFAAAVPTGGTVVVPAYDPAIRTRSGGYVNAGSKALS